MVHVSIAAIFSLVSVIVNMAGTGSDCSEPGRQRDG